MHRDLPGQSRGSSGMATFLNAPGMRRSLAHRILLQPTPTSHVWRQRGTLKNTPFRLRESADPERLGLAIWRARLAPKALAQREPAPSPPARFCPHRLSGNSIKPPVAREPQGNAELKRNDVRSSRFQRTWQTEVPETRGLSRVRKRLPGSSGRRAGAGLSRP